MKILNSLTLLGDLVLSGVGRRIRGDFSNATVASRTIVQTDTANAATSFGVMPNGTGNGATLVLHASNDTTNASIGQVYANSTEVALTATRIGTGAYKPMALYTSDAKALNIDTSGNVLALRGAIGYGIGAGGTATQPSDKNTAVTLNKPSGLVTMATGVIPANSAVAFQVVNSHVAQGDTVSAALIGGLTTGGSGYVIDVQAPASGSFYIVVRNISATATPSGDQQQIQFNVHKGARS